MDKKTIKLLIFTASLVILFESTVIIIAILKHDSLTAIGYLPLLIWSSAGIGVLIREGRRTHDNK